MATPEVVHIRDTRANQPAAAVGNAGVLYCVTDEGDIIERSNGTTWDSYSPVAIDEANVNITGGSITGITDLAIADGGTGASTATAAFDNLSPTTTAGDLIYHNGTDNVRLGIGTAGQVLKVNGGATAPEWGTGGGTVAGPVSSTDHAIARWDGAGGGTLQDSPVIADDAGNVSGVLALSATTIELGHASDTTLARSGAGDITVEGNAVYRAGGTDVPVADGGTGVSSLTAYAPIFGGTTGTGAVQSGTVGTSGHVLTSNGAGALPTFQAPAGGGSGAVVQVVNTQTGAMTTGSTSIPHDDTIPQNTEGNEVMTLAITPTSATNKLKIEVVAFATIDVASRWLIGALFQDSTVNAIAAGQSFNDTSTAGVLMAFTHYMTAGTTSATTFKVRLGSSGADQITFNGQNGARRLGGVMASSITITEIVP